MITKNALYQSIFRVALVTGALLLIPLIAQLITDEMNWDETDFIVVGFLLFCTGLTYTLISRQSNNLIYRVATGLALFSALFLVWSNLAVGIIGSEENVENTIYFG